MGYSTEKSKVLFYQTKNYLENGVASSLHKAPDEEYPIYAAFGKGSRFVDVDGNEYIDYMGSFGPSILGFSHPALNKAVINQVEKGSHFALPTETLGELAKKLVEIIPCGGMVGFQSTGTEANMTAFRIARAYTGKAKIIRFEGHYHGWTDELNISFKPSSIKAMGPRSCPWKTLESPGQLPSAVNEIIVLPWNDLDILERTLKRQGNVIAAVIMEPIMCNTEPILPQPGYLEGVRELTKKYEVLFILDEVITGFRLALGGAQEYFGIIPDISIFAKAVAGGYPISGVIGRREIINSGVHPAGTFNANPVCVVAALATIKELEKPGTYENLTKITTMLKDGVNVLAKQYNVKLWCESMVSIWQLSFGIDAPMKDYVDTFKVDKQTYGMFYKKCLKRGIRLHSSRGRFYISTTHTEEDVKQTLAVFEEVFKEMF